MFLTVMAIRYTCLALTYDQMRTKDETEGLAPL